MAHGHVGKCPMCKTFEIQRILRRHKALIAGNKTSIASFSNKGHILRKQIGIMRSHI
jgi:hypothetical protein